jgi:hypothetical protein
MSSDRHRTLETTAVTPLSTKCQEPRSVLTPNAVGAIGAAVLAAALLVASVLAYLQACHDLALGLGTTATGVSAISMFVRAWLRCMGLHQTARDFSTKPGACE